MCVGDSGGGGDGGAADREAERQARIAAGTEAVNKIFGVGDDTAKASRDQLYTTVGDDTRKYYASQLEEDRDAARRALEFQKRYDRGLLDVANRSDTAASGMRTSDEQARLGLISKVAGGIDQGSAVSSAMSQLQSNLDNSRNEAMTGRMGNVFSDLIGGYTAGQTAAGIQQAKNQYGNTLGNFINAASDNGTVR